jgi:hypothetical protein
MDIGWLSNLTRGNWPKKVSKNTERWHKNTQNPEFTELPMMPPFGFGGGCGFFGRPSSSSPSSSSFFSEPQIGHSISANGQMISQSDSNNNDNSNNNDYDYEGMNYFIVAF